MNFVKCVKWKKEKGVKWKMEKDHYVVINVYHVTARVHLRHVTFYQNISLIQAGRIWHLYLYKNFNL